jgi:CheY-like chemotaxis protein
MAIAKRDGSEIEMSQPDGATAAEPRITPLRILLAEDAEDNVYLIRSYLEGTGHTLETAENGEEAVRKFTEGNFQLVLMDMQMPVLDGYRATRQIRAWEREHHKAPTPIVALTAFALKEEYDKSIEAGCNAHLSKPIRRQTLLAGIAEYAGGNPGVSQVPILNRDREGAVVKSEVGRAGVTVKVAGNLKDVLPGYLERRRTDVQTIRAALEKGLYDTIRIAGHRMKGSGAGYGMDRITEIGSGLEDAAASGNAEGIGKLAQELEEFLDSTRIEYG